MSQTSVEYSMKPMQHPLTNWDAEQILEKLTAELPKPNTDLQQQALDALRAGEYSRCKIYPCLALNDPFVKAIGYLSSVPTVVTKGVPTLPTLLGESCRAIADACYNQAVLDGKALEQAEVHQQSVVEALQAVNRQIFSKALGS